MSAISTFITKIRTAVYGEQVRGAIADAIEQCYDDVSSPSLNTAAFATAIAEAYADGFLDIQEKSTIAGMTNTKIIYRYTGNESGYYPNTLYFYDGKKWSPIGTSESNEDAHALVYGGTAQAVESNYEIGSFSNGQPVSASNRLRTKDFIDEDITHISVASGFSVLSIAFTKSGSYVGYWNGTDYAVGTATYRDDFDLPSAYKYKLLLKNNSSDNISKRDAEKITYTRNGIAASIISNSEEIAKIKTFVDYDESSGTDETYSYADLVREFGVAYRDSYIFSSAVGQTIQDAVTASGGDTTEIFVVPIAGGSEINYPVFKSSYGLGSCFADANKTIISYLANSTVKSGTQVDVTAPSNARYFVLVLSPSLLSLKNSISLSVAVAEDTASDSDVLFSLNKARVRFLPYESTLANEINSSMCLCGIKTKYEDEKIPFHEGFLFHKLNGNENKLYYGRTLEEQNEIGSVPFNVNNYFYGISPSDGRIICGRREAQGNLYVFDGENTTTLFGSATRKPYGWLYTTGIEFITDDQDQEWCVFGEYAHSGSAPFYVWRGKYPYTSESDWQIVMTINSVSNTETVGSIRHFHQVRRDPWTDVLYLTSGDNKNQLNWWYSTDYGATWTLLLNDGSVGWEDHVARCCNMVFTEEFIYWGSDHGENHCLNRIARDSETGIIDPTSRKKLCDLPWGFATNSICYVEHLNALLCYDRADGYSKFSSIYDKPIKLLLYLIDQKTLVTLAEVPKDNDWGGFRGKCYINYTSGQEPRPAMGFSADTPCQFKFIGASSGLGTVFFDL